MTFLDVVVGSTRYPKVKLEWAPTTDPTLGVASQTWVDITNRLRGWEWRYGRNDETSDFEAGRGFVLLDNRDRALEPSYTSGPWYGHLLPRRMFRLQAQIGGSDYTVFTGYARGFPQEWPADGYDSSVRVDLTDILGLLEGVSLLGFTRPEELSSDRAGALMIAAGIVDGAAGFGTVNVAAITDAEASLTVLGHLRDVAIAEGARVYVGPDGVLQFLGRTYGYTLDTSGVTAVFTDAGAGVGYSPDFTVTFDDNYLWNDAIVSGPESDDTPGHATDSASQTRFHPVSKTVPSILPNLVDRQALAEWYVYRFAQPQYRASEFHVPGGSLTAALWDTLFFVLPGVRVDIKRYAGTTHEMLLRQTVEAVGHACKPGGPWELTFATSPADTSHYWTLEDATYGFIDTDGIVIAA